MYNEVARHLEQIPEVVNTHYTTGGYSIFAKIICRDTKHLQQVLHDKIQHIPGVQRTETLISLEERIDRSIRLDGIDL
jgi:Lrp/AsnC family transcriptional regulator for asnA, asnC and gidA